MLQLNIGAGHSIDYACKRAIEEAPCFFLFNGFRIEAVDSMKLDSDRAHQFLRDYYFATISKKPLPVWNELGGAPSLPKEEPCKHCRRKCFTTDTKCWWCETPNPCRK